MPARVTFVVITSLRPTRIASGRKITGGTDEELLRTDLKNVDLEQVDLPRSNTENAKSGVKFIFKSEPSVTTPEPDGSAPPPAQPDSSQPNAVPQPEART